MRNAVAREEQGAQTRREREVRERRDVVVCEIYGILALCTVVLVSGALNTQ